MSKIIGIIGGMGPLASIDLQRRIIENTKASCDQEHLHVITDCNTQIPDRTAAILAGGEDPLPRLTESALRLVLAGAQVLIMGCNTAHYYFDALREQVEIPFLSMPESAVQEAIDRGARRVCILSTTGTQAVGLYEKLCKEKGLEVSELDEEESILLMRVIYGVKAGEMGYGTEEMKQLLDKKQKEGVELFLLACTELPIYFYINQLEAPYVDATQAIAREAIRFAGGILTDL